MGRCMGGMRSTGQLLTNWPVSVAVPASLQPAPRIIECGVWGIEAAADLDGDGSPEILVDVAQS